MAAPSRCCCRRLMIRKNQCQGQQSEPWRGLVQRAPSTRPPATNASKTKPRDNRIASRVSNLQNSEDQLASAAADTLETVLQRSGTPAAVQDLRTVQRFEDTIAVESRATAESAAP